MISIPKTTGQIMDLFTILAVFTVILAADKRLRSRKNFILIVFFSVFLSFVDLRINSIGDFLIPIIILAFIHGPTVRITDKIRLYFLSLLINAISVSIAAAIVMRVINVESLNNFLSNTLFILIDICITYLVSFTLVFAYLKVIEYVNTKIRYRDASVWKMLTAAIILLALSVSAITIVSRLLNQQTILLTINLLIITIFVILTVGVVFFYISAYKQRLSAAKELEQAKNSAIYLKELQKNYDELRTFKHDYKNLLGTVSILNKERQYDEAEALLNKFLDKSHQEDRDMTLYATELTRITDSAVKGLIVSKLSIMQQNDIEFSVEVNNTTGNITSKTVDLLRILGILFDNAIEGTIPATSPQIRFTLLKTSNDTEITIRNTTDSESVNLSKLPIRGYTTKSDHTGLGLSTVHKLCDKNGFMVRYSFKEQIFTATLNLPPEETE